MTAHKLKACPFCGFDWATIKDHVAMCTLCGARTSQGDDDDDAQLKWNLRPEIHTKVLTMELIQACERVWAAPPGLPAIEYARAIERFRNAVAEAKEWVNRDE
jgi:hypothetical protein